MSKVKWAVASHKRRKKIFKRAKGQTGARSKLLRTATESVKRARAYSYRDRKDKKRLFRNLWVLRVSGACKEMGLSYSKFIDGLKKANISLNRKMLAWIAVNDKKAFGELVKAVKA